MKPRNKQERFTAARSKAAKPRFHIEKLEERVAPRCHWNPHGKFVGCHYSGRYR